MKEYQKRIVEELNELGDKIEKLLSFIESEEFDKLPNEKRMALTEQYYAMVNYYGTLEGRLYYDGINPYQEVCAETNDIKESE